MESLSEAASPCWVCPPHCTPRLHWGWSSCSILPCCKSSPSLQSAPPASLLKIFQHKWNQLSKISCRHLFAFTKLTLGKTNARTPSILGGGAGELRQFNANWGRITTNNDNEDNANENNDNEDNANKKLQWEQQQRGHRRREAIQCQLWEKSPPPLISCTR